jgi:chromatin licensing and DNA replication factor 1
MSQPTVTAYFNTRKRQACDDLRGKSKVLLLERDHANRQANVENLEQSFPDENSTSPKVVLKDAPENSKDGIRANKVVRNINFNSPTRATSEKTNKPRPRITRSRMLLSVDEGQADIRDSMLKMGNSEQEIKTVPFEKKGTLSPKKKHPQTPKKNLAALNDNKEFEKEQDASGSLTPSSSKNNLKSVANNNLSLSDIKNKINKSSRLMELKASMQRIMDNDQKLKQLQQKQTDTKKPQMQKFEKIELEIPVRYLIFILFYLI